MLREGDRYAYEGDEVTLTCQTEEKLPGKATWYLGDNKFVLGPDDEIDKFTGNDKGELQSVLTLNVRTESKGVYKCAYNGKNSLNSMNVTPLTGILEYVQYQEYGKK